MAIKSKPAVDEPVLRPGPLTVVIDADAFDASLHDPKMQKTNEEATAFLERLEREGKNL